MNTNIEVDAVSASPDHLTYPFCVGNNADNFHTNWYGTFNAAINDCAACEYCYQRAPDKSIFYVAISAAPLKLKCNYYKPEFYEVRKSEYTLFARCGPTICRLNDLGNDIFEAEALQNSDVSLYIKLGKKELKYTIVVNDGTCIAMRDTTSKIEYPMKFQEQPTDIKVNIKYGTATDNITFRVVPIDPAKYSVKVRSMA